MFCFYVAWKDNIIILALFKNDRFGWKIMIDDYKVAFYPAVELSYLIPEEQAALLDAMDSEQATPSLSQAQRLKKFSQEGRLSEDVMRAILSEEKKPEVGKITLSSDKLRRYFPKSYTPQQMEQTIFRLLEQWQRRRQRDLERQKTPSYDEEAGANLAPASSDKQMW